MGRQPIEIPSSQVPPLNLGLLADIISMHSFAYSYSGRSTSPPCRDNVQYFVLDSPANKIDKDQMSAIHRLLRCHPDEDLRSTPTCGAITDTPPLTNKDTSDTSNGTNFYLLLLIFRYCVFLLDASIDNMS